MSQQPKTEKTVNLKSTVNFSANSFFTKNLEYVDGEIVAIDSLKDLKQSPAPANAEPKSVKDVSSPLKNPEFTAFPDSQPSKFIPPKFFQKIQNTAKLVFRKL